MGLTSHVFIKTLAGNKVEWDGAPCSDNYEFELILLKVLYHNSSCLVSLLMKEMHCFSDIDNSEAGLNTKSFHSRSKTKSIPYPEDNI